MSVKDFKAYLNKLSKQDIIKLAGNMYNINKQIKEYCDNLATPNPAGNLNKYKNLVFDAFYPSRGDKLKIGDGRKAIANFKKLKPPVEHIADIMLYYTEMGVEFTCEFGDIDEKFYDSMENNFMKTLEYMHKNNLLEQFKGRCRNVVDATVNTGWGFHDTLSDFYFEYYQD